MLENALFILFTAPLVCAAYFDVTSMTIPNWISLVLLSTFFIAGYLMNLSWDDFMYRFACGAVFLGAGFILFNFGQFGGGDVKLMAASMVWIGFGQALTFLIWMSFLGAMIAIVKAVWVLLTDRELNFMARWKRVLKSEIPYGVAIAGASIIASPLTPFLFP